MPALSPDIALADDIVEEIRNRTWSLAFDVERVFLPEWTQRDGELETLRVAVNPSMEGSSGGRGERNEIFEAWTIDVTVCQRLATFTRRELDALLDLVEELRQWLDLQAFELADGRRFEGQGFDYLLRFDPTTLERVRDKEDDHEKFSGTFKSAFQVTFELRR